MITAENSAGKGVSGEMGNPAMLPGRGSASITGSYWVSTPLRAALHHERDVAYVTRMGDRPRGERSAHVARASLRDRDEFLTDRRGGGGVDRPVQRPASANLGATGTELGGDVVHRFLHPLRGSWWLVGLVCAFFHKEANGYPVMWRTRR